MKPIDPDVWPLMRLKLEHSNSMVEDDLRLLTELATEHRLLVQGLQAVLKTLLDDAETLVQHVRHNLAAKDGAAGSGSPAVGPEGSVLVADNDEDVDWGEDLSFREQLVLQVTHDVIHRKDIPRADWAALVRKTVDDIIGPEKKEGPP